MRSNGSHKFAFYLRRPGSRVLVAVLLPLALCCAGVNHAVAADSTDSAIVKHVRHTAKQIAAKSRDATRRARTTIRRDAHVLGKDIATSAKRVGPAIRDGAKQVGAAARKGAREIRGALTPRSD